MAGKSGGQKQRLWLIAVVVTIGVTLSPALLSSQLRQTRILVLYGSPPGGPAQRVAATTFRERLESSRAQSVAIHEEFVDFSRLANAESRLPASGLATFAAFRDYLAAKYAATQLDVVVLVAPSALQFYEQFGRPLFGKTPAVAFGIKRSRVAPLASDSLFTAVVDSVDLAGSVRLGLRLQPRTKQLFVIGGASALDQNYLEMARAQLAAIDSAVSITYLVGWTPARLQREAASLSPGSIILYLALTADSTGAEYTGAGPLEQIVAASAVPVYGWYQTHLSSGIAGGSILRTDSSATIAASMVLRVLAGVRPSAIPIRDADANVPTVDWRALRRWHIDERLVPKGTVVAFRERTLWARYRGIIMGVVALIIAQSAVITALAVQRAHRQRAEAKSRALLDDLRGAYEQTQQLARRLMTAQESERSRIGRELHDDVSQKIAALSIALSQFRRRLPVESRQLHDEVMKLQDRAVDLASDVRHLSHQLHSSVLQHAGLMAALRAACAEVERQHDIEVTMAAPEEIDASPEAVLCLYRVAQEALRNTATHAAAQHIHVTLAREEREIRLSVADDGQGFEASAPRRTRGLGLISLEERVRLLDGTLRIDSRPGRGTDIRVSLPMRRSPSGASQTSPIEPYASHDGTAR